MAVELATAASSGFVQVLLVGFGPELDRLERVHRVDRREDALPDLERQAQEAAELVSTRPRSARSSAVASPATAPTPGAQPSC